MANFAECPNYHCLTVEARGKWHEIAKEYYRYFEKYDCSEVRYAIMKGSVLEFIRDKLIEVSRDNSDDAATTARFYLYAIDNYMENLDLCMDIYLLVSMWDSGEHVESHDIEWYIMFKYGPW